MVELADTGDLKSLAFWLVGSNPTPGTNPRFKSFQTMPVNLSPPSVLLPVGGIQLGTARAVKSKTRHDLAVLTLPAGAAVAGVFTRNRFPAPPVQICQRHLAAQNPVRALAINSGIANAGTLGAGLEDARKCCENLAKLLAVPAESVLPFSTGVIMERLPVKKYAQGLRSCVAGLKADNWTAAARAIMTTDIVPKGASRQVRDGGKTFTLTGIAKGSGMIHPNMATMLAFAAADAAIPAQTLRAWQRKIVRETFNAVSVDGDTSTNDSFLMMATGAAGAPSRTGAAKLRAAFAEVCAELAEAIVRDGEGAGKIMTIRVRGATASARRRVADSIACSPLVKTALAAGDANIGRFLMAIGNAGGGFDPDRVSAWIGDAPIILGGGVHPQRSESAAMAAMKRDEVELTVHLDNGGGECVLKTCDLTAEYIRINAAYRS